MNESEGERRRVKEGKEEEREDTSEAVLGEEWASVQLTTILSCLTVICVVYVVCVVCVVCVVYVERWQFIVTLHTCLSNTYFDIDSVAHCLFPKHKVCPHRMVHHCTS